MSTPKFDVLQFSPDPTKQSMPLAERVRQLEVENAELADQRDKLHFANALLSQRIVSLLRLEGRSKPQQ